MKVRKTKQQINDEATVEKLITPVEVGVLKNWAIKAKEKPIVELRLAKKDGGRLKLEVDHNDEAIGKALLMSTLGSHNVAFVDGIVEQLLYLNRYSDETVFLRRANFMLSIIKGIEPRDQLATMLAMQMAAVHELCMKAVWRLDRSENVIEQDSTVGALTKLTRTFASQIEALARHRTGAEQKVTLQQVSVTDGGQAIVGNVTQAPRDNVSEAGATPQRPAFTATNVVPMPNINESKKRVRLKVRRTTK
jgi:hypothetical protein